MCVCGGGGGGGEGMYLILNIIFSLLSQFMQEQSDFLVVGVLGKQGVGKSTVMSLLAGTRTGAGK